MGKIRMKVPVHRVGTAESKLAILLTKAIREFFAEVLDG